MSRRFPWSVLGIAETSDTAAIRKAYADALRAINVDEDIAGYADLRSARDQALWLAAHGTRHDDGDLGLGDLDDAWDDDADADADADAYAEDWDDGPEVYHPDPLAPHLGSGPCSAPGLSEERQRAQAAWHALRKLLYPAGAPSDDALTDTELDDGLAALAVLTARADAADLVEYDSLDGALAELFASTWPRSAPFVEPANAAFHWLDEDGSIEERPALMFLNQRLKGMRFHEKVQQPGHPLHKAWVELSRPGTAAIVDRLKVKRLDIHKLITGIRDRYPELESYLDPKRVASWNPKPDAGAGGLGPMSGIFLLLAVLAVPSLFAQFAPRSDDSAPIVSVGESQLMQAEIDAQVITIFGPGTDIKVVQAEDPKLARELMMAIKNSEIVVPLHYVRMQALASAEVADRTALEARAELKAIWLTAAQAKSAQICRMAINGDLRALTLDLDKKDRAREQELLRQLLAAKVLSHMPKGGETRYSIPGWLVGETVKRSGLSQEELKAALTDPDSADRCKAETALMQAVIAAPDKVPDDVMRGL